MKKNLYTSVHDLARDISLIRENAEKFNGQEHPVASLAREVEEEFNNWMYSEYLNGWIFYCSCNLHAEQPMPRTIQVPKYFF